MRELKRITVDPQVKNGLPCIRDTGVTVSEIVKQVTHEKTSQEVLADYPNLESDDIEEALAYAVNDLSQAMSTTAFDMRVPLTSIQGFSQLFLGFTQSGEITNEQKIEFVKAISINSARLNQMLYNSLNWSRSIYGILFTKWTGIAISDVLKQAGISADQNFEINVAENLPLIRENSLLSIVFSGLIKDDFFRRLDIEARITVSHPSETRISVEIERHYIADPQYPEQRVENTFLYPNNPVAAATVILQEHNSELQIHPIEGGVIFTFELPIWEDENP